MRDPDITGAFGRAWLSKSIETCKTPHSALAQYMLERPGAHVLWERWEVSVIHLRPVEGLGDAFKEYPEAEYELKIIALNPDHAADPDVAPWAYLLPPDLVFQFHGVGDTRAAALALHVATACCNGASPDSDFRRWWTRHLKTRIDGMRKAS